MNLDYQKFIKDFNDGKIEYIIFAVKNYSHYRECIIKKVYDVFENEKTIERIEIKLTKSDFEKISFYGKFEENFKLFSMGRKGTFTLKQLWSNIKILDIKYNNSFENYTNFN